MLAGLLLVSLALLGEIAGELVVELFSGSIYKSARFFRRRIRYASLLGIRRTRLIHA
jgi:hypothetical protein